MISVGFIEWCNQNQGFLMAIMSSCSLLVSITAIVISVITARIPYRKTVSLWSYNDWDSETDMYTVNIFITNIGNRGLRIRSAQVYLNGELLGDAHIEGSGSRYLPPTDTLKLTVSFQDRSSCFKPHDKFRIVVYDVAGKKYSIKSGCALG